MPTTQAPARRSESGRAGGTTLDTLRPGQCGVVRSVEGAGDAHRRLLEMGIVAGTEVRLVRLAPLGDPMEIRLRGYHLSIRRSEARTVVVDPA